MRFVTGSNVDLTQNMTLRNDKNGRAIHVDDTMPYLSYTRQSNGLPAIPVSSCSEMPLQPEIAWPTHPTPLVASVHGCMLVRRVSNLFGKYTGYLVHAAPASTQR